MTAFDDQIQTHPTVARNCLVSGVFPGADKATWTRGGNIRRFVDDVTGGEVEAVIDETLPPSRAGGSWTYIVGRTQGVCGVLFGKAGSMTRGGSIDHGAIGRRPRA